MARAVAFLKQWLEGKPKRELNHARVTVCPRDLSHRARLADVIVRIPEVRMIQNVHEIRPERQLESLRDWERLEGAHIPVEIMRTEEGIGSSVTESVRRRRGIRQRIE